MNQKDLVIGLDSSTTACKAVVWNMSGDLIAEGRADHPLLNPHPDWFEQPASAWWVAACHALRVATSQVDRNRLAAICITAQRETFVPIDDGGRLLYNGILWMDERSQPLLKEIKHLYEPVSFQTETGKPLTANLTVGKIVWLREFEPKVFRNTFKFLDVAGYLTYKLTGRYYTGWGCADPTGLFDIRRKEWSKPILELAGLRVDQLPEVFPPGEIIGEVSPETAAECGIPAGLPLVAGIGDGQAGSLGAGVMQPGQVSLSLGTSVITGTFTTSYVTGQAFRTMCSALPGSYILENVLLGGTFTIDWLNRFLRKNINEFATNTISEDSLFNQKVDEIPTGASGLMLVPYWNGSMDPYWDSAASGIVVGWRGRHQPEHFYRAILEGIGYELRAQISGVESALSEPLQRFIASGGGARNATWLHIIADITGKSVYRTWTPEATALGAGILAAQAVGLFPDLYSAVAAMTRLDSQPIRPDLEQHAIYTHLYDEVYSHLFPDLQSLLDHLTELTESINKKN